MDLTPLRGVPPPDETFLRLLNIVLSPGSPIYDTTVPRRRPQQQGQKQQQQQGRVSSSSSLEGKENIRFSPADRSSLASDTTDIQV